jgi:cysteine dioxygenase
MSDPRLPDRILSTSASTSTSESQSPLALRGPVMEAPPSRVTEIARPLSTPTAKTRPIAPAIVPGGYPLWELPAPLRRLCSALEAAAVDGAVPLELAAARLDQLDLDLQAPAPWWIFDAVKYRRNLIRRTSDYEMLLLCWLPGQRSPIHDHRGSGCAFRVIEGIVSETIYEHATGDLATPAAMRWLPPGTICASRDFDIHEVANTQAQQDLVTLHVYSPPLRDVNQYRSTETAPAS